MEDELLTGLGASLIDGDLTDDSLLRQTAKPTAIRILLEANVVKQFQLVDGREPELIERAIEGEHVGTIVHDDNR